MAARRRPTRRSSTHSSTVAGFLWTKPNLPRKKRTQTLLVRRDNMPYFVAATAWNRDPAPGGTGRTLGCTKWNAQVVDALRAFRDEHRSNGPEPIP